MSWDMVLVYFIRLKVMVMELFVQQTLIVIQMEINVVIHHLMKERQEVVQLELLIIVERYVTHISITLWITLLEIVKQSLLVIKKHEFKDF